MLSQAAQRVRRDARRSEADDRRDAAGARGHARRAAQGHTRAAAGDGRDRLPDAARHRRPDRGAGRAQPHRRPPRPRPRRGRAGAPDGDGRRRRSPDGDGRGGRTPGRAGRRRCASRRWPRGADRCQWQRAAGAGPPARGHHRRGCSRHAGPPGGGALAEPGTGRRRAHGMALRTAHARLAGGRAAAA